jgi:hypothetical protein
LRPPTNCSGPSCPSQPVFAPPDYWHGLSGCLKNLRQVWTRKGGDAAVVLPTGETRSIRDLIRDQVQAELGKPTTGIATGLSTQFVRIRKMPSGHEDFRLALLNEGRRPYNAMGHTGVAYILYTIADVAEADHYPAAQADAAFYRMVARGALRTVLTPVSDGGLSTTRSCLRLEATCTWYHSITRRDRPTEAGATLNQHLHAVRDLGMIADKFRNTGRAVPFDVESAFQKGVNQLFASSGHTRAGSPPNLENFVSPVIGKTGHRWAYYGFNPSATPPDGPYFLNEDGDDCEYQVHVLDLLSQILARPQEAKLGLSRTDSALACNSPILALHKSAVWQESYKEKLRTLAPRNAQGLSCPTTTTYDRQTATRASFSKAFASCL